MMGVDVDDDKQDKAFVMEVNNGTLVVPTIIFPDGNVLYFCVSFTGCTSNDGFC